MSLDRLAARFAQMVEAAMAGDNPTDRLVAGCSRFRSSFALAASISYPAAQNTAREG